MVKRTWNLWLKRKPKIVGPLIRIGFPELGIKQVTAKVDTGAFSGALHARDIKEIVDEKNRKWLEFVPLTNGSKPIRTDAFHLRSVRSSNGVREQRYAIETNISIDNEIYPIVVTLSDRSNMKREVLIGRNFLRSHGFLVDVGQLSK